MKTLFCLIVLFTAFFSVTFSCAANGKCDSSDGICLNMPFSDSDKIYVDNNPNSFDIISEYVGMVYKWWAVVTGLLAVLMVVVGGVQYIISGADPSQKDDAKSRIQQALIAMTLLLLSALILRTINPNFFT